jgi:nicotinamidase-related amidase
MQDRTIHSPIMRILRRTFIALLPLLLPLTALAQSSQSKQTPVKAKSVLLVVDAQVGVLSSVWESQRVVANLEKLVAKARSANTLVVWVQHSDEELKFGSDGWKLAPGFVPSSSEIVLHKKFNSSFANTDLDKQLRAHGITRVVLAGAATNWCIRATAYAAVDRGYHLALVSDAHSTESMTFKDGRVVSAESIVSDLNVVFKWLSAPNVRTEVLDTAGLSF